MKSLSITDWFKDTLESIKRDARESWNAQSTAERITTIFLATMIVGGLLLRIQGVGSPPSFTFDEEPFVRNAHNYALGLPDTNDHPPLGKMLIGVGLTLFGFNSFGWRFVPLCFGLQTVVLAYWLGRTVFADRRAGWMAAAFVAADGFFISYSRSGLLDGMMVCLALWGVLAAVAAQSWRGVLTSAILIGLSTSVKWSGIFAVIPAGIALLTQRRMPIRSMLWLGAAPFVHISGLDECVVDNGTEERSVVHLERNSGLVPSSLGLGSLQERTFVVMVGLADLMEARRREAVRRRSAEALFLERRQSRVLVLRYIEHAGSANQRRLLCPAHAPQEILVQLSWTPSDQVGVTDGTRLVFIYRTLDCNEFDSRQIHIQPLLPALLRLRPNYAGRICRVPRAQTTSLDPRFRRRRTRRVDLLRTGVGRIRNDYGGGQSPFVFRGLATIIRVLFDCRRLSGPEPKLAQCVTAAIRICRDHLVRMIDAGRPLSEKLA